MGVTLNFFPMAFQSIFATQQTQFSRLCVRARFFIDAEKCVCGRESYFQLVHIAVILVMT